MSTPPKAQSKRLVAAIALIGSAAVHAEQPAVSTPPPASSPMTATPARAMAPESAEQPSMNPEDMKGSMQMMPDSSAHAPDASLERPAASERYKPPAMPGMDMDDASIQHRVFIENLEAVNSARNGGAWDAQAWVGGDFNKLWLKSESSRLAERTEGAKLEALWAHAIRPFWDFQLGARHDFGAGPARVWGALGIQGIAPYWFDVEATAYAGDAGRTAARLKVEYDLYLTQRWVLKPEVELNAYGRADPQRQIGSGLSDGQFELRLRAASTRRFAPYVGFVWDRKFGATATMARSNGDSAIDHRLVGGLQFFL